MATRRQLTIRLLALLCTFRCLPLSNAQSQEQAPIDKGLRGEQTTDGLNYAFDRIAFEVTKSQGERPALVIWLLDVSGSARARSQKAIERSAQFHTGTREHPLYAAVASFGRGIRLPMVEPTPDHAELLKVAEQLQDDNSGTEAVFTGTISCLTFWKRFLDKHESIDVSIIVVTDERGSDLHQLDAAISACKAVGARVLCLGNAAPFGSSTGRVRHVYPDGFVEWIPVDQGPETRLPETLDFPLWPPNDDQPDVTLSSGFGPWGLCRLCRETNGRFFIAEDTTEKKFQKSVMARYEPNYADWESQLRDGEAGRLRNALSSVTNGRTFSRADLPKTVFRADTRGTLGHFLLNAQKDTAYLDDQLAKSESELRKMLNIREKLTDDRRLAAAFDLTLGRLLAMRARLELLKVELARKKSVPGEFANEENNTWTILPAVTQRAEAPESDTIELATRLLTRVTVDHPNTPFAFIAAEELKLGFGWKWQESHKVHRGPPPENLFRPLLIREVNPPNGGGFFGGGQGRRRVITRSKPGI
jgi:hypothetical protein